MRKLSARASKYLLILLLAGCSGGNSGSNGGNPEPPVPPPPPPPPPVMCEWDDTITADDPACVEPPRCEWDVSIYADDPLCVEPPPPRTQCQLDIAWTNPTHDINENELGPADLIAASAFFFRIPELPREAVFVHGLDAYTLHFTFVGGEESFDITYYVWLTVTNEFGESDPSNQISKTCL